MRKKRVQEGLVWLFHSRPWLSMALPGGDIPCTGGALPTWQPTLSSVAFYISLLEGPALVTQGLPCRGMFADQTLYRPGDSIVMGAISPLCLAKSWSCWWWLL